MPAGKSSPTNEMITQSKQQTRNIQTTCQKLLCKRQTLPLPPKAPLKSGQKRTVLGNILPAESQKEVLSKSTDENNITGTRKNSERTGAENGENAMAMPASKMAMATLPFPLPTLRATFSHSWQNVEQTQTQTQKQQQRQQQKQQQQRQRQNDSET